MLVLLACSAALAPQRIDIPPKLGQPPRVVQMRVDGRIVMISPEDASRLRLNDQKLSPYYYQPPRRIWPYNQLPVRPKPVDPKDQKARSWLTQR